MGKKIKKKDVKAIYEIIITLIAIIFAIINWYNNRNEEVDASTRINIITAEESQNVILEGDNKIQIHFFDVGQADSILLISNNKTMLIDAGTNDMGKTVVQDIKKLGISRIDYLIGTHPHEDHIGGLDDVIKNFDIGTIYMPKIQTNTKTFEDVLDAISNKNLKITSPKQADTFKVGDIDCEIMLCDSKLSNEKNNFIFGIGHNHKIIFRQKFIFC